ncbi:MAG: nucleotidyltransferase family protein [Spirochaetales bacterium]|jgi:hypothetical protein|nr:nucleotidyltransferase family protein [Spirochaetales bacterium]
MLNFTMRLTNEQKLVLSCAASRHAESANSKIAELLDAHIDWNAVLLESQWHGVLPAVYNKIRGSFADSISDEGVDLLADAFDDELKRSMLLSSVLFSLLDDFDDAGITAVPYKGPVFADRYYGSIAHRTFWDLDILMSRKDILPAKEIMLKRGYVPEDSWNRMQERRNLRLNCEYNFDKPGTHVELHWGFVRKYIRFEIDPEDVINNTETMSFLGRSVHMLDPSNRFLILCVHNGVKHHWHRLRMITDLAILFEKDISQDWQAIIEKGRRLGLLNAMSTGAELAKSLLGIDLPAGFSQLLEDPSPAAGLSEKMRSMMFSERENPPHAFAFNRISLLLRERCNDRLRFLPHILKGIFFPTDKEERLIPGEGLFVILIRNIIRPIRLLAKYVTLLKHQRKVY